MVTLRDALYRLVTADPATIEDLADEHAEAALEAECRAESDYYAALYDALAAIRRAAEQGWAHSH